MVASAILEKAASEIEIDGRTYQIADPTIATIILISEIISTLPVVENVPVEQRLYAALHYAKDYKAVGDICAILILGAKGLNVEEEITEEKRLFGVFKRKRTRRVRTNKRAELSRLIIENMRPSVVFDCIVSRLQDMEIASFFAITTSLSEVNILKPTKEVEMS